MLFRSASLYLSLSLCLSLSVTLLPYISLFLPSPSPLCLFSLSLFLLLSSHCLSLFHPHFRYGGVCGGRAFPDRVPGRGGPAASSKDPQLPQAPDHVVPGWTQDPFQQSNVKKNNFTHSFFLFFFFCQFLCIRVCFCYHVCVRVCVFVFMLCGA